ncbi:hypothetical protein B0H10DRAFT_1959234 [Mycena sp. CBHHK59/15]|nr:hypothetical protein B0H10DRAFT_1959234 [Mycena sp. CBHHK59/15]
MEADPKEKPADFGRTRRDWGSILMAVADQIAAEFEFRSQGRAQPCGYSQLVMISARTPDNSCIYTTNPILQVRKQDFVLHRKLKTRHIGLDGPREPTKEGEWRQEVVVFCLESQRRFRNGPELTGMHKLKVLTSGRASDEAGNFFPFPMFSVSGIGIIARLERMVSFVAEEEDAVPPAVDVVSGPKPKLLIANQNLNLSAQVVIQLGMKLNLIFERIEKEFQVVITRTISYAGTKHVWELFNALICFDLTGKPLDVPTISWTEITIFEQQELVKLSVEASIIVVIVVAEAEGAITLCHNNFTAIMCLHIKDLARFSARLEEAQSQVMTNLPQHVPATVR